MRVKIPRLLVYIGIPLFSLLSLMLVLAFPTLTENSHLRASLSSISLALTNDARGVAPPLTVFGNDTVTSTVFLPCVFRGYDPNACYDQYPGDLSSKGNPPEGIYRGPEMTYDIQNFDVYTRQIHSRVITVAIERGFDLREDLTGEEWDAQELADFVFHTWAIYWREFQGFPWESYTVVFGYNLPYGDTGAYPLGFQTSHFRTPWIAHEIYHAWNGCDFRQAGERTWYMEGVTVYYGDLRQTTENPFEGIARSFYGYYLDYYNSGQDRPLADMSMNDPDYNHTFVAVKGALVAYLLDLELARTGHHIGEVSRLLYERYGMGTEGKPTNEEILAVFNEVSGADFTPFFEQYIYGTKRLPLTEQSDFEWVCHN